MPFLSHKLIDYMKHAVFVVGLCDKIRLFQYGRLCIGHGDAKSGRLDHCDIVVSIAAADHLIRRKAAAGQKAEKRMGLIDARRHDLQKERIGAVYA